VTLCLQQLAARAGQVVEVASTDYVSLASSEHPRSSDPHRGSSKRKGGSSSQEAADKAADVADAEEASLVWKVQVVGLQLALLSVSRLGTAQFVADGFSLSQALLSSSVTMEVRFGARAVFRTALFPRAQALQLHCARTTC
jgi:hypothetical protein